MRLTDKVYDVLKWVAMYLLPGLGTLYFALSQIWGLPYGEQVVGTATAIDTFLAVILGISNASYSGHGTMQIDTSNPEKDTYRLSMDIPIEDIAGRKSITLKVDPNAKLD